KARPQRNRTSKQDELRRSVILAVDVSLLNSSSSPASSPSPSETTPVQKRASRTSSEYSVPDSEPRSGANADKRRWPLPLTASPGRRMGAQKLQKGPPQPASVAARQPLAKDSEAVRTRSARPARPSSNGTQANVSN